MPESPSELIGQSLMFKVSIIGVKNLPVNFCRNLKVEYQTFYDRQINYTKLYNENDSNLTEFKIGEEIEHKIDYLTKEDVDYLEKEKLCFKVYAFEDDVDYLEKEKLCFKVYAFEDVEKKGRQSIDDVLKIDKVVDEQLDEPTEDIQKTGSINDNINNNNIIINNTNNMNMNNNINNMNNMNNNRVDKNKKFGYSNNNQKMEWINPKKSKMTNDKFNKQKNDKDCIII